MAKDLHRPASCLIAAAAAVRLLGCAPADAPPDPSSVRELLPRAEALRPVPPPDGRGAVLVVQSAGRAVGYVVDRRAVSRSGPFTVRVVLDESFRVLGAEVTSYPGERGREVRGRSFLRQFTGKGPGDPVRVGADVQAVTGATISSRAAADAVRDAIRQARAAAEGRRERDYDTVASLLRGFQPKGLAE